MAGAGSWCKRNVPIRRGGHVFLYRQQARLKPHAGACSFSSLGGTVISRGCGQGWSDPRNHCPSNRPRCRCPDRCSHFRQEAEAEGARRGWDTGQIEAVLGLPHWFWAGAVLLASALMVGAALKYALAEHRLRPPPPCPRQNSPDRRA